MLAHVEVRAGAYADSVTLLQVSKTVQGVSGVDAAQVAMATALNCEVLVQMGFELPDALSANDLLIAIRAKDEDALRSALHQAQAELSRPTVPLPGAGVAVAPRTTASALRHFPGSLALISVPGEHAFVEAVDALDSGSDVMVFSDNVALDQEIWLKRRAAESGLLVMGPDCGTAVLGGLGLGFANSVAPGPVGIVAASGTGCQQMLCLLDAAGVGVRHALGVGGRDLSDQVGGLATHEALRRLDADADVALIVVVSKPPGSAVAAEIRSVADELTTPVEFALLGAGAADLTAAATRVVEHLAGPVPAWPRWQPETPRTVSGPKPVLRGLYAGGTLASEAALIAGQRLGQVHTEPDALQGGGHAVVDFGADELTQGRAHPMIDPTIRTAELRRLGDRDEAAVLLLDVVLGHGAEPDPASGLSGPIAATATPVVIALIGTDLDPQGRSGQAEQLTAAGAEVYLSNAEATRRALELLEDV